MNTCYARVQGGIGNQLFIIAAGFAYSKKYSKKFAIDTSKWTASQGKNINEYKNTIFKNFIFENAPDDTFIINEKRFNYDKLPNNDSSVILSGFFQSLKYFEEFSEEFITKLQLPNIQHDFLQEKNVAVHIRRGDYLQYKDIHYVCNSQYFKTQLLRFQGFQQHTFTDSIDYVKIEFNEYPLNILKTDSELDDLILMSKYDNIICSNSSFSWWASFLGKKKTQIIVPDRWFNNFEPHEDIYRSDFIKVSV